MLVDLESFAHYDFLPVAVLSPRRAYSFASEKQLPTAFQEVDEGRGGNLDGIRSGLSLTTLTNTHARIEAVAQVRYSGLYPRIDWFIGRGADDLVQVVPQVLVKGEVGANSVGECFNSFDGHLMDIVVAPGI